MKSFFEELGDEKDILNSDESIIPIERFIHKELVHFSNSDTKRSIGSLYDGLKPIWSRDYNLM